MARSTLLVLVLAAGCGDDAGGTGDGGGDGGTTTDGARPDGASPDTPPCTGACGSIRFTGQGSTYGDRVQFRLDDPATTTAGPPLDVGATDFTIELWMRAQAADNPNTISCGAGFNWTASNIILDRDRHNQSPSWGFGIQSGAIVWAVNTADGAHSLCGDIGVTDDAWHHVAVDRRRSDGRIRIWVDGQLDAAVDGPDGDVSYPDDGEPLSVCPMGSCTYSDPFLVLGAEKHGYGGISYTGLVDELRVSNVLRYDAAFARPTAAFTADANAVGLYHFDETSGLTAADSSSASPSVSGEVVLGGGGPQWASDAPF